jgi:tetratricopeptide (TPR) repeat protein
VIVKYSENSVLPFIDNVIYAAPNILIQWATAFELLFQYAGKAIFPITLSSDYSNSQTSLTSWNNPISWLSLMIHVALLGYAIFKIRSKDLVAYGILFYLIGFSIYSNLFIVIGSALGERFLFTPVLGVCIIIANIIYNISKKASEYQKNGSTTKSVFARNLSFIIMLAILIPYTIKTYSRNSDWKSSFTLYHADIKNSPQSARLKYFYGNEVRVNRANSAPSNEEKVKYLNESIKYYSKALEIYPDYKAAIGGLGISYYRLGDKKQAYNYYSQAINMNTTEATTYNNMGVLFSETGKHSKALEYYLRAVLYDPYYFDAWKNLGNAYYDLGNNEKSIQSFYEALKFEPDNADCNYWLALGLQQKGETKEANKYFNKAFKLNPSLRAK